MRTEGDSELPQDLLAVLPTDPFEQLELARKITSMAMASRLSKLEAETGKLRLKLGEKENTVYNLQQHIVELEQSLQQTTVRLSHALDEQAKLTNEKNLLVATVKKLNRDVAKLETFKRTLMQSLQEDGEPESKREDGEKTFRYSSLNSLASPSFLKESDSSSNRLHIADDGSGTVSTKFNSEQARFTSVQSASDLATLAATKEDNHHPDVDVKLGSQRVLMWTPPQLTPAGSPKKQSTTVSPLWKSASGSPRWHSTSDARFSLPSSQSASQHTTAPNSPPAGSFPARTPRVDGKEFFRQARNRLSYEQFSAFLANIKELNAHRQSREETLRKADEIFGAQNRDLYKAFDGLLSRHLPS